MKTKILFFSLCMATFAMAQTIDDSHSQEPNRGGDFACSGVVISGSTATVTLCSADYEPIVTLQEHPTTFNVVLPSGLQYGFSGTLALLNTSYVDSLVIREVDTSNNTLKRTSFTGANNGSISFPAQFTTGRFAFDIYCYNLGTGTSAGFSISISPLEQTELGYACASYLGVGTCSPQKTLHVNGDLRLSSPQNSSYFDLNTSSGGIGFASNSKSFFFNNKIYTNNGLYSSGYNDLTLGTNGAAQMTILNTNGNVGIGTAAPLQKLDVDGKVFLRTVDINQGWANSYLYWAGHSLVMGTPPGVAAHNSLDLKPGGTALIDDPLYSRLRMYSATFIDEQTQKIELQTEGNCWFINEGNFGIGTTAPAYKLDVAGEIRSDSIRAQAINVQAVSGADFVFEKDYNLLSLDEVKTFIQANGHLPEIQSAEDMQINGVNISDFQIQLLQKIEELTLYIIKQEERIKKLESNMKK